MILSTFPSVRSLLCSCAGAVLLSALPFLPAEASARILSPLGNWVVESGEIEVLDGENASYCSISNAYAENSRLEFYGTEARLAALKIDLPGQDLSEGDGYDVSLSIPGAYNSSVRALALDTKTLMLNVKMDTDLPVALTHGTILYVGFGAQDYAFSLSGIKHFSDRLRVCDDDKMLLSSVVKPSPVNVSMSANADPVILHSAAAQQAMDILQGIPDMSVQGPDNSLLEPVLELGAPDMARDRAGRVVPPVSIDPFPGAERNPGTRSDRVSFITEAASAPLELGKSLHPRREAIGVMEKDVSVSEGKDSGFPDPVFIPADPQDFLSVAPVQDRAEISSVVLEQARLQIVPPRVLQALKGSDVREVLEFWSEEENVELVWDSLDAFEVRESLNQQTSYEQAVESLLMQYDGVPEGLPRPVARLHINGDTGRRVLLVRSERVL